MRYKDFYVRITPDKYIPRVDKKGDKILCEGFLIQILSLIHISEPTRP